MQPPLTQGVETVSSSVTASLSRPPSRRSGTRTEGIDRSEATDTLAVATPFDGWAIMVVDSFEFVATLDRRDLGGVKGIGSAVVTAFGGRCTVARSPDHCASSSPVLAAMSTAS